MSLLKTVGPGIVLIAGICLGGAGCSSSPLQKSSGPLDRLVRPFSSGKKAKKSKQADTIPTAASVGYTPNEAKSK